MCYYMDSNNFSAENDSRMIQAAIDEASRSGCNKVVIPALNKRTGAYLWVISETILIPSHMYIEINNAHLRMADGVICQMFRNSNGTEPISATPEGLQEDIILRGVGRALLDGGVHNGVLQEGPAKKEGMPHVSNNLTIFFHHVRNFRVEGLTIRDQRWFAMSFDYCWEGIISDIRFEITDKSYRPSAPNYYAHPWRNQDGINLRIGCHDIQIRNITGETCDDMIALTALGHPGSGRYEDANRCEHLSPDIFNVTIRDICGMTNHCALVRLLCHFRNQVYNVSIDNLVDATPDSQPLVVDDGQRTATCVKIGELGYQKDNRENMCRLGELRNISVSRVFSSAWAAVALNCMVKNITIRDVFVGDKGQHALSVSRIVAGRHVDLEDPDNVTTAQNIYVDGVRFTSTREGAVPFFFNGLTARNFVVRNVSRGTAALVEATRMQADSEEVRFENVTREN